MTVEGGPAAEEFARAVAETLARWRRYAGLTQAELAQRAGLSERAIGHYEAGSRSIGLRTFARIAEVLRVPLYRIAIDVETANLSIRDRRAS